MKKTEQTFVMIKPDGMKQKIIGECLNRFEKAGLYIRGYFVLICAYIFLNSGNVT